MSTSAQSFGGITLACQLDEHTRLSADSNKVRPDLVTILLWDSGNRFSLGSVELSKADAKKLGKYLIELSES